jgi:hypothetical protein
VLGPVLNLPSVSHVSHCVASKMLPVSFQHIDQKNSRSGKMFCILYGYVFDFLEKIIAVFFSQREFVVFKRIKIAWSILRYARR